MKSIRKELIDLLGDAGTVDRMLEQAIQTRPQYGRAWVWRMVLSPPLDKLIARKPSATKKARKLQNQLQMVWETGPSENADARLRQVIGADHVS